MNLIVLGENVQRELDRKGYVSVRQAARMTGVCKSTINAVVNGNIIPRLDTVYYLAKHLGVTIDKLMEGV